MYKTHPVFISPEDTDVKIWRYLDIPKYLSLLEKRALFFTRADLLGDQFEGSLPSAQGQLNLTEVNRQKLAKHLGISTDQVEPYSIHDGIRKSMYVCSFHMNPYESAALWSIYSKANQGVAIQSTFNRLIESFKGYSENPIFIGMMNYIDYNTEVIPISKNLFLPIVYKRKSFEHEKELRAVIPYPEENFREDIDGNRIVHTYNTDKKGLYIKVDLDVLIERIYVAPTTEPWVKELLRSITKKYELDKSIEQSSLDGNPII